MSFVSPLFLWYFMPAILIAVVVLPRGSRNGIVAIGSLIFYATGAGAFTLLLLICMVVNYLAGPVLEPDPWNLRPQRQRRWLLIGVVVFDLSILLVWKYAGFATEQIAWFTPVRRRLPHRRPGAADRDLLLHVPPHLYVVDVYRGDRPALRNPVDLRQLHLDVPAAGRRARSCATTRSPTSSPSARRTGWTTSRPGFPRFALGLARRSSSPTRSRRSPTRCSRTPGRSTDHRDRVARRARLHAAALLRLLRLLRHGDRARRDVRLPAAENFDRPYSRVSITDFWRRWHMSLSRWFRDYVYIPLGGNRPGGAARTATCSSSSSLTGLWHGANWTFLFWGALPRRAAARSSARPAGTGVPATGQRVVARRAVTLLLVDLGWVFFRARDLG